MAAVPEAASNAAAPFVFATAQYESGDWDSAPSFEEPASTGRGVASVRERTVPGGVVRGKTQDVLNLLGSSGVFKIDHDGLLEVDL